MYNGSICLPSGNWVRNPEEKGTAFVNHKYVQPNGFSTKNQRTSLKFSVIEDLNKIEHLKAKKSPWT